jgi:hypothetical protein
MEQKMKIAIDEVGIDTGFGNVTSKRLALLEVNEHPHTAVKNWMNKNRPELDLASLSKPHGIHAYLIN